MLVSFYPRPVLLWCLVAMGCGGFRPRDYQDTVALYRESLRRLQAGDHRAAIAGFDRLTLELATRDTLLTRSNFYLGQAYAGNKNWLEAARVWNTLATQFADDTLADDAILLAGRAYLKMWPDPELDDSYGRAALAMYETLLQNYPTTPLRAEAEAAIAEVNMLLAEKDFRIAEFLYKRHRCPACAIIYLKDVIALYPDTPQARTSYARMAEIYKAIAFTDDLKETCELARQRYPDDKRIQSVCNGAGAGVPPPR
jgi:outer membrane protein assembly factor BamD